MTWLCTTHRGGSFGHSQCTSYLFLFFSLYTHPTQALADERDTHGFGTGKNYGFIVTRGIPGDSGSVLHQLWLIPKRLSSMSVMLAQG